MIQTLNFKDNMSLMFVKNSLCQIHIEVVTKLINKILNFSKWKELLLLFGYILQSTLYKWFNTYWRFWKSSWFHKWELKLNKDSWQRVGLSSQHYSCSRSWSQRWSHSPLAWPHRLPSPTRSSWLFPATATFLTCYYHSLPLASYYSQSQIRTIYIWQQETVPCQCHSLYEVVLTSTDTYTSSYRQLLTRDDDTCCTWPPLDKWQWREIRIH